MDLHRPFSRREKILLLILGLLITVAAYLFLVHFPATDQLYQLDSETASVQDQITIMTAMTEKMDVMEEELEQAQANGPLAPIPDYDNLQQVMNFLNAALAQSIDYSLSFQGTTAAEDSALIDRTMSMAVTLPSYQEARAMLIRLEACPYRCSIDQLSILPAKNEDGSDSKAQSITDGPVSLSAQLTFYELKK